MRALLIWRGVKLHVLEIKQKKRRKLAGTMAPDNPWRAPVLADESITWAGSRGHGGGPSGVPAEVIGLILERVFVHRRRCRKAAMHAQLVAQKDWALSYTVGADHSFMEPGKAQYCFADVMPPLWNEAEGVGYADDTGWFSTGPRASWTDARFEMAGNATWSASDPSLQSEEKLLPLISGFRILGCEMSLADVLSRAEGPDLNKRDRDR